MAQVKLTYFERKDLKISDTTGGNYEIFFKP